MATPTRRRRIDISPDVRQRSLDRAKQRQSSIYSGHIGVNIYASITGLLVVRFEHVIHHNYESAENSLSSHIKHIILHTSLSAFIFGEFYGGGSRTAAKFFCKFQEERERERERSCM